MYVGSFVSCGFMGLCFVLVIDVCCFGFLVVMVILVVLVLMMLVMLMMVVMLMMLVMLTTNGDDVDDVDDDVDDGGGGGVAPPPLLTYISFLFILLGMALVSTFKTAFVSCPLSSIVC